MVPDPIVVYKSSFCPHSWSVERFLKSNNIPAMFINIDRDPQARQDLMAMNNGFASVPTLLFPDGSQLTEPSFSQIRAQLGMEKSGFGAWLKRAIGRKG